jgi:hypothetical protein
MDQVEVNVKLTNVRPYAVLALCIALAGCAQVVPGSPGTTTPRAAYLGPIPSDVTYDNAGVTLKVPPANSRPTASWADAYTTNCATGDAICDPTQSPTIYLATATTPSAGDTQPDGSIKPLLQDTLVYVIQWTDVPCTPVGPAAPEGAAASTPTTYSCTILNLVDAETGKVLYSVQGPNL